MDKKQILVTALTLTVGICVGSLWMGSTSTASTGVQTQEEQGHDADHSNEGAAKESVDGGHAEGEAEEGHLTLSDDQIRSAGIQLIEAK